MVFKDTDSSPGISSNVIWNKSYEEVKENSLVGVFKVPRHVLLTQT